MTSVLCPADVASIAPNRGAREVGVSRTRRERLTHAGPEWNEDDSLVIVRGNESPLAYRERLR